MRASTDRILTTHVGALPAYPGLWGAKGLDEQLLPTAVADVVRRQRAAGTDIVNEGEYTKAGHWTQFVSERLGGFEPAPAGGSLELLADSADWKEFGAFYQAAAEGGTLFESTRTTGDQTRNMDWACTSPVRYVGQQQLQREIACLKNALGDVPPGDAFLTSTAPASLVPGRENRYYKTEEEYLYALADAMSVEYEAIVKAGLLLQVDDAWLAALWDRIGVKMGLEAYQRWCNVRVDALNHALRNIPAERVRYHLCWGSWHGPHAHDIPMRDMVQVMLRVKAQAYLFEAANARHEHEYTIWQSVKLPDDKILVPGVVSHATTLIEHPELVSQRIQRFANIVGRERVMGGTDCGLGLRCHEQIAWAKLKALADGAALASAALWGRKSVA
jgi:5-methyltetrahydropteroyltriglutamate--homocysteine methyltransferase